MSTKIICALVVSIISSSLCAAVNAIDFEGAEWIWNQTADQDAGTWFFQQGFEFPAGQKAKSAKVLITCDNLWTLHVNGKMVGQNDSAPDSWRRPQVIDVRQHLVIEQNAIAVEAQNTVPGPSGLLVKMVVEFEDGKIFKLKSDGSWNSTSRPENGWTGNGFNGGSHWASVNVLGQYGMAPWGRLDVAAKTPRGKARKKKKAPPRIDKEYPKETDFAADFFKDGIVFVSDSTGLASPGQRTFTQNIRHTRGYTEMDPMTPAAIGKKLWSLIPLRPDGKKTLLYDAKGGFVGSPTISYDGKTVYFSLVKSGEAFFHVYAVTPDGTNLRQITDGPFHDYDPVELPDGRIAFSSTRIGSREEYHAKYASSIFACQPDGSMIRPITYHIVADREPRVMADGSLTFIRSDNFMERAKVEVHLHQTRLDGTAGQVIIGPDRKGIKMDRDAAAEHDMRWLRKFGAGSPAPLPDGRVAAINTKGLVTSAEVGGKLFGNGFLPYDLSALPDGKLLCTSHYKSKIVLFDPNSDAAKEVVTAAQMGVRDLHSVVHLGVKKKPAAMPSMIQADADRDVNKTGFLYCQNVLNTQHTAADLKRIKAVRIYEGRPFTLEPTKSIYEHIGTMGIELGTVPLADDGSFYVEVPADRALAMQAVDGEGRAVINELSWIYTRPGEQRACAGCHAPVDSAPAMQASKALRSRPLSLLGQANPHRFRANNGANGGIVNLQMDRFREVAAINLSQEEENLTISEVQRLGILRDRSAVPQLVEALKSDRVEMRCAAAISLSACGNRDAVKPLMVALNDSNPLVAKAVANALEHLTGNPAGGDAWAAIEAGLIEKLNSIEKQAVHLAIEALGHVGGEAGKTSIRRFLEKNPADELRVLMAAIRSLGYLKDDQAVSMLVKIMNDNLTKKGKGGDHELGFGQKPVYLSATSAEALGWIGGAEAERAIIEAFTRLNSFEDYNFRTAEHKWLKGVHASVVHFRMLEALDRMKSTGSESLLKKIIESIPADKDRGLLYELDSYEKLTARMIKRSGKTDEVVEACLKVLGDQAAPSDMDAALIAAVSKAPHAEKHIRAHSAQARAAQILSVVCNNLKYADRIRAVLLKYRAEKPSETRSWCCFMLTRLLGRLGDKEAVPMLIEMLNGPTETAQGLNPAPAHNVYKGWRPFYRPAAAWALGQLNESGASGMLLNIVKDLDNASSTRVQAAISLGIVGDQNTAVKLKKIGEEYPEITTRRAMLKSAEQIEQR